VTLKPVATEPSKRRCTEADLWGREKVCGSRGLGVLTEYEAEVGNRLATRLVKRWCFPRQQDIRLEDFERMRQARGPVCDDGGGCTAHGVKTVV